MPVANQRLEFRIPASSKDRIARAASILDLPVSEFARTAAEEKAEAVIREHESVIMVPAEFFDNLLAALDEPAQPAAALVLAMRQANQTLIRS